MATPNKPVIDVRTKEFDEQPSDNSTNTTPAKTPADVTADDSLAANTDTGEAAAASSATENPYEYTASSYDELIPQLEKHVAQYKPLSEEQLKKIRRRQKIEGIISGVSDAAQSVANLIATHNYAPNMYDAKEGMSAKARERFDKAKAEREADDDKYLRYALTLGKLKEGEADKKYQRGRDALQDRIRLSQETRAQLKADRDAAMAALKTELMLGKINEQQAAARAKNIEAEYADQYWKARVEEINSSTNKNDRWQPSLRRSGGGGGGGRPGEHVWRDKDGNLHYCHSESAARSQAAANGGTYVTTPKIRTETFTGKGREVTTDVSTPKVEIDWKD